MKIARRPLTRSPRSSLRPLVSHFGDLPLERTVHYAHPHNAGPIAHSYVSNVVNTHISDEDEKLRFLRLKNDLEQWNSLVRGRA